MKLRLKPAFRSRLLATGVSVVAFVAIVSGFVQEWQDFAPEQSVKLAGANDPLPPEILVTQKPIPAVTPESTPTASVSPTDASSPSPVTGTSPTAKPTKSASSNAIAPSPSATPKPTVKPTSDAVPSVNPSPSSVSGVAPAAPVVPEAIETAPEQDVVVYTCISPKKDTRDPVEGRCMTRWGYVLTQVQ
jgi:hypothetical protein